MNMNLRIIYEKTQTESDALEFAQQLGLINLRSRICNACGGNMNREQAKSRHLINTRLRCGKKICRKSISIFHQTLFDGSHLQLSKAIQCLYLHCANFNYKNIAKELSTDRKTVSKFMKKVNSIFTHLNRNDLYGKLGYNLPETVIEIDETHIVSRRDGRGRVLRGEQVWVIGAICRDTKTIRLKIVKRRNKNVCENFALNNISPNSK
jgi:hypothetical protein